MSSKKNARRTVPLELFLSGLSDVEKDHPVIVVDHTRRHRAFSGRGVSDRTRSFSNSGSSFCSSVTSCSLGSTPSNAALCTSRWESIPQSRKTADKANRDNSLRLPRRRDQGLCLRLPSRTRTNDLKVKTTVSPTNSKAQKQHAVMVSPCRRMRPLRCDSKGSSRRELKATMQSSL